MMKKKELISEMVEISAKTMLSAIPVGGTLITSILDSVKAHTIKKRTEEWTRQIEDRISHLEITLGDIGENELFTSALMKASEIALKTAEDEKRGYLAQAVKNSVDSSLEESVMMIYLDMLDRYTVWHIRILNLFRNPSGFKQVDISQIGRGSASQIVSLVYPDIAQEKELLNKIVKDLQSDGVMSEGNYLSLSMSPAGVLQSRTTNMGNAFLDYIMG